MNNCLAGKGDDICLCCIGFDVGRIFRANDWMVAEDECDEIDLFCNDGDADGIGMCLYVFDCEDKNDDDDDDDDRACKDDVEDCKC